MRDINDNGACFKISSMEEMKIQFILFKTSLTSEPVEFQYLTSVGDFE